jgi:hypothetical protein
MFLRTGWMPSGTIRGIGDVVKDYPDAKGMDGLLEASSGGLWRRGIGTALEEKKSYA